MQITKDVLHGHNACTDCMNKSDLITQITESTRSWKFELSRASENDRKVFSCSILPALQEFAVKIDCLKSELKNHGNVKKWQIP